MQLVPIVKGTCYKYEGDVYIYRNVSRGVKAVTRGMKAVTRGMDANTAVASVKYQAMGLSSQRAEG